MSPQGEESIVLSDHTSGGDQMDVLRRALEDIVRIGTAPRDSMLSEARQYRERGQAMLDVANAALDQPWGAVDPSEVERLRAAIRLLLWYADNGWDMRAGHGEALAEARLLVPRALDEGDADAS